MRFSSVIVAIFAAGVWAAPAHDMEPQYGTIVARADNSTTNSTSSSGGGLTISGPTGMDEQCDAKGICTPGGGAAACDDKCKACTGPQGNYTWGTCCGLVTKACCCYY